MSMVAALGQGKRESVSAWVATKLTLTHDSPSLDIVRVGNAAGVRQRRDIYAIDMCLFVDMPTLKSYIKRLFV